MERKIGEIFEHNGDWYQVVDGDSCGECSLRATECWTGTKSDLADEVFGKCSKARRSDNKHIIFKKLEKWGEPYPNADKLYQLYRLPMNIEKLPHTEGINLVRFDIVEIEIKQNKEDMEEKKLIELLSEKVHNAWMKEKEAQGFSYGKDYDKEKKKHPDMLPYNELKEEVKEYDRATVRAVLQAQKELQSKYNYNNLKPFDIEAAKAGKPVCTRDGHKARIICFDYAGETGDYPIVALVSYNKGNNCYERVLKYTSDGLFNKYGDCQHDDDLMMLPEKKEGWVNVYNDTPIYDTKERAELGALTVRKRIATVKISWEE